ncbi:MAG: O-antigen ligase family protein, partial [Candidatus Woesebacteria bacterium]|nr:O-antigen ligase family protein [Candidatus Woesebacteria bacterium]
IILSLSGEKIKDFLKKSHLLSIFVILTLFLTFSLNAIIVSAILIILHFALNNYPNIIKKVKIFLPITLICLSLLFGILSPVFSKGVSLKETYKERITLAGYAIDAFSQRPVLGVGLNNFFFATKSIQPPHNIYLIVLSETGIVGIIILFLLLLKLLSRNLNKYLFLAVVFVLVTGLFDHYWFTLQQNQLLLSFLLGLAVRKEYSKNLYGK